MRALFEYIKAKINTDLPEYLTTDPYNNQDTNINNRIEEIVTFPAVMPEFIINEVESLAFGIRRIDLTIRFWFMLEDYTFTRLDDWDTVNSFAVEMEGFAGGESDPVQFTSFEQTGQEIDETHDQINRPYIEYHTIYRDVTRYYRQSQVLVTPVELDLTACITEAESIFSEGIFTPNIFQ